ncbi:hypothetical protein VPHK460_0022 [Vibrio phage K460]
MTEQKLRKFKLIDRKGYFGSSRSNKRIYETEFDKDIVEGWINELGELDSTKGHNCVITDDEFQFFEEVFDTVEEEFTPTINEVCEVSRADDLETWYKFIPRAKYTPHYLSEEQYVGDWQSEDVSWKVEQISAENFVFRPIPEKTWQEKLCEEFADFDTESDIISYHGSMGKEDMVLFAKRILELSEGE